MTTSYGGGLRPSLFFNAAPPRRHRLFLKNLLTSKDFMGIIIKLFGKWRRSSVGQSTRFIPGVSLVQIQSPLPSTGRQVRRPVLVRPGGQAAKTPPFQGGDAGSTPVPVTTRLCWNWQTGWSQNPLRKRCGFKSHQPHHMHKALNN